MQAPTQPSEFIGKTQRIAKVLWRKADIFLANPKATDDLLNIEKCWLFLGPPGCGKSRLAKLLANRFCHESMQDHINGRSLTLDVVRHWYSQRGFLPMAGDFHVKLVDEIDGATPAACDDIRTWLACLPKRTIVLATTNKPLEALQEQLQSRFQQWPFESIPTADICAHLINTIRLPAEKAKDIAEGVEGNVRAALADAASYFDMQSLATA